MEKTRHPELSLGSPKYAAQSTSRPIREILRAKKRTQDDVPENTVKIKINLSMLLTNSLLIRN
jgi:hypothetical protein